MDRRPAIREIFLSMDRSAEYRLSPVARVIGMSQREILRRIQAGEIEAREQRGQYLVAWPEIASLAIVKWSLAVITSELGERAKDALPPLVQPRQFVTLLPACQVEMIYRLARRAGTTPDSFLSNHLLDLAASEAETIERELPGFIDAMRWPDE